MSTTKAKARRERPSRPAPVQPASEQPAPDQAGPGCAEGAAQLVVRHVVSATCWLQPEDGQDYPELVSFSGRRAGVSGRPRRGDRFDKVETVGPIVPGSGPVSVTTKVADVAAGNGSSG
jgi:hypothetical protein